MLRITRKLTDRERFTLALEGRIASDWVQVLEDECGRVMADESEICLDFSGVTYVDARGTELLRRLVRQGVQIINCPAMILDLLQTDG